MKNLIIIAAVRFVNLEAAHDNFKAQYKVTCTHDINFYLPIDAPGAGKFGPGYILTVSSEKKAVKHTAANPNVAGSKDRDYINLRGEIKILKIELPIKQVNTDFDALPDVIIAQRETTVATGSAPRV